MSAAADARTLRLEGLTKRFEGPHPVVVFEDLALEVRAGEFFSIVGPSGCGKSTLLQVIAGLIPATQGRVLLGGRDVTGEPAHMVYLFQQYAKSLLPWMTAEDNVIFAFNHRLRLGPREARERAREHLAMVGLADSAASYPWQLSGGMQQRVAIARALSADPKVLLMDEPFSSVDALTRMELHSLIAELWERERFTAILVTHDVDEAIFLADRIALLTRRPARIAELMQTELARPRRAVETHENPRFLALRHALLDGLLHGPDEADARVR